MLDTNTLVLVNASASAVAVAVTWGYKPPAGLVAAADAFDAANHYEPDDHIDVNVEAATVTAKDVPALIARLTDQAVRRQHVGPILGDVRGTLARRVINQVRAAAPDLAAAYCAPFNSAAEAFTDAYARLSGVAWRDPAQLLASGHEKVKAFEEARALVPDLDAIRQSRDHLARMSMTGKAKGHEGVEAGTRYCEVADSQTAATAAQILKANEATPLGVWANLLEVDGVTRLRLLPIPEHAAYIATIVVAPVDQFPHKRVRVGGDFVGFSKQVR